MRAAIQEANQHPGADTITLQPNTKYLLTRADTDTQFPRALLNITDSVTILGAGAGSSVIDGNNGVISYTVLQLTGTNVISGITIQNGRAFNIGGGLINTGRLDLINSSIFSNTASGLNDWGGGIYNAGPLTMTNSSIVRNSTGNHNAYGGGIYNQAEMLVVNSVISGNSTFKGSSSPGQGGGIFNIGYTTTIVNSLIYGNLAELGGGVYKGGYPMTVINSTIAGNNSAGDGGGFYASSGTSGLYNVTVVGNTANEDGAGSAVGGGVFNKAGSTLTFRNSIIAQNGSVQDTGGPFDILLSDQCAGTITSQGNNTVTPQDDPSHCTIGGAVSTADPDLGPLADNGGPTRSFLPMPGSPVIDAGNPAGCTDEFGAFLTTDQRGAPRKVGAACDQGAVEANAKPALSSLIPSSTTVSASGVTVSIEGAGFIPGTIGLWNGAIRATSVISPTRLALAVPAGDIASAGTYTVAARYGEAADSLSNALPFTVKANQSISFAALPDRVAGEPPFAVSATASSGLPVSFSAAGVCSIAGNIVTLTGSGTCTITAFQAGDALTNAAPDVARAFTVKANQAISFGALVDRFVGELPFAISATASSGLPVSFTASGSCTVASSTVSLTGPGTCMITASQAGDMLTNAAPDVARTFTVSLPRVFLGAAFDFYQSSW